MIINMKTSILVIFVVFLALTGNKITCEPQVTSQFSEQVHPILVKRSLCNTYGGCGTKRSFSPYETGYKSENFNANNGARLNVKTRPGLFGDPALDRMQTDQRQSRPGGYFVLVPRLDNVLRHYGNNAPQLGFSDGPSQGEQRNGIVYRETF